MYDLPWYTICDWIQIDTEHPQNGLGKLGWRTYLHSQSPIPWQCGHLAAQSPCTMLLAVVKNDNTLTVQSLCLVGDWWNRSFTVIVGVNVVHTVCMMCMFVQRSLHQVAFLLCKGNKKAHDSHQFDHTLIMLHWALACTKGYFVNFSIRYSGELGF